MALERLLHGLPVLLPEPGAALDVREQEGEGLRRRLGTQLPQAYVHAVSIRPAAWR